MCEDVALTFGSSLCRLHSSMRTAHSAKSLLLAAGQDKKNLLRMPCGALGACGTRSCLREATLRGEAYMTAAPYMSELCCMPHFTEVMGRSKPLVPQRWWSGCRQCRAAELLPVPHDLTHDSHRPGLVRSHMGGWTVRKAGRPVHGRSLSLSSSTLSERAHHAGGVQQG